jgi:hypothetical protein
MAMAATTSGCTMTDTRSISIRGATYEFHRKNILAIAEKQDNSQYISVQPNDKRFTVIYSSLSEKMKYTDTNIEIVNLIEETPNNKLKFHNTDGIDVVCQNLKSLTRCGFTISDRGVVWSILIHNEDISHSSEIKRIALLFLRDARR